MSKHTSTPSFRDFLWMAFLSFLILGILYVFAWHVSVNVSFGGR